MTMIFNNLMDERNLELRPGDKYRFCHMSGEDGDRTIELDSWTTSGEVAYRIHMDDGIKKLPGRDHVSDTVITLHTIPIDRIPWLVLNRVWVPIADDEAYVHDGALPSDGPVDPRTIEMEED